MMCLRRQLLPQIQIPLFDLVCDHISLSDRDRLHQSKLATMSVSWDLNDSITVSQSTIISQRNREKK